MSDRCQLQEQIAELHTRTAALTIAAIDMDDRFLNYLYRLVMRHLEETSGVSTSDRADVSCTRPDPAIAQLGDQVRSLAGRN